MACDSDCFENNLKDMCDTTYINQETFGHGGQCTTSGGCSFFAWGGGPALDPLLYDVQYVTCTAAHIINNGASLFDINSTLKWTLYVYLINFILKHVHCTV